MTHEEVGGSIKMTFHAPDDFHAPDGFHASGDFPERFLLPLLLSGVALKRSN